MAKILLGQGVAGLSGSILGTTFSRNSNGAYARNKSIPVNTNTPAQQEARAIFAGVSASYRNLTPAQRAEWRDGAPNFPYIDIFGQTKQYTGNQLFMKLNMNLRGIEKLQIENLPVPVALPLVDKLNALAQFGDSERLLLNSEALVPADFTLEVYFSPPVSNSIDFYSAKALRRFGIITSGLAYDSEDFYQAYVDRYGLPADGQKIFYGYRLVSNSTGQATKTTVFPVTWEETTP